MLYEIDFDFRGKQLDKYYLGQEHLMAFKVFLGTSSKFKNNCSKKFTLVHKLYFWRFHNQVCSKALGNHLRIPWQEASGTFLALADR